jgi:hypothetical protein
MAEGALWGGTIGGMTGTGIGIGITVGGDSPDQYLSVGNFQEKFEQGNLNSADNVVNGMQGVEQTVQPGGLAPGNLLGLSGNLFSSGPTAGGWFSIPISHFNQAYNSANPNNV